MIISHFDVNKIYWSERSHIYKRGWKPRYRCPNCEAHFGDKYDYGYDVLNGIGTCPQCGKKCFVKKTVWEPSLTEEQKQLGAVKEISGRLIREPRLIFGMEMPIWFFPRYKWEIAEEILI